MLSHVDGDVHGMYVEVSTASNHTIKLSTEHYLFITEHMAQQFSSLKVVQAQHAKPGQYVWVVPTEHNSMPGMPLQPSLITGKYGDAGALYLTDNMQKQHQQPSFRLRAFVVPSSEVDMHKLMKLQVYVRKLCKACSIRLRCKAQSWSMA